MGDIDFNEDAVAKLSPSEVVAALRRVDPADPAIKKLDIDVIGRRIDPRKLSTDEFVGLLSAIGTLADAGADVDLSKMDAQNFARIISRASSGQIETATSTPGLRGRVLDELFRRMSSHFIPERARDGRVVMQFRVTGGAGDGGFDHYSVVIDNRECSVAKKPSEDAKTTITLSPADLLKLATGNASATMMFLRGKVKVTGSLGFASGFMGMFEVPKA
ncbi:MAG: SCP2 sterol-binding domain-containing protein [Haloechinothrix sp.]